jgi:hypothetical protein
MGKMIDVIGTIGMNCIIMYNRVRKGQWFESVVFSDTQVCLNTSCSSSAATVLKVARLGHFGTYPAIKVGCLRLMEQQQHSSS